jgi:hypothetical protein
MNLKQTIRTLLFTTLISGFSVANASEGVSFYYGAGIGGLKLNEDSGAVGTDIAYGGELFIGFEERGWAFEVARMATTDTGTDDPDLDFGVSADILSLSYRTVERSGMYYKIKYAQTSVDLEAIDTTPSGSTTKTTIDDKAYGVGVGMRVNREDRVELEYNYVKLGENTGVDSAHMLNLRYIFGGTKP